MNSLDKYNVSPIMAAAYAGQWEFVAYLISSYHIDLDNVNTLDGRTILHLYAADYHKKEFPQIVFAAKDLVNHQ